MTLIPPFEAGCLAYAGHPAKTFALLTSLLIDYREGGNGYVDCLDLR